MALSRFLNSIQPDKLFLIDTAGALVSGSMLAFVLASFEEVFGVSPETLQILGFIAFGFSLYSFSCYLFKPKRWRPFLRAIAIANLLYCCLTAVMVLGMESGITLWGVAYFVGEIIVVVALGLIEFLRCKF